MTTNTLGAAKTQCWVLGFIYYVIALWDAFANKGPVKNSTIEVIRLVLMSMSGCGSGLNYRIDATIYFFVFMNLTVTIDNLKDKAQHAKLQFFYSLRSLLILSIIVATMILGLFSIAIFYYYKPQLWIYQWM